MVHITALSSSSQGSTGKQLTRGEGITLDVGHVFVRLDAGEELVLDQYKVTTTLALPRLITLPALR